MKKEKFVLIVHIIIQVAFFIPILSMIKFHQDIDTGIIIAFLLCIINFIAYVITVFDTNNRFRIKHSILILFFIISMIFEDLIACHLVLAEYLELIIYGLLIFQSLELLYSLKNKLNDYKIFVSILILISIGLQFFEIEMHRLILDGLLLFLYLCPLIVYLSHKDTTTYDRSITIFLQICLVIVLLISKKYAYIELITISEGQSISILLIELILLFRVLNTNIKKEILFFANTIKIFAPRYIIIVSLFYWLGFTVIQIIILSAYITMFNIELTLYKVYKKVEVFTLEELLEGYFVDRYKKTEVDRLNILKIQTFLHDEILQRIIATRRGIQDNLVGTNKVELLNGLEKLNDLIRHEINSFDPELYRYSSLYNAYEKLIEDVEDMYLDKEMLIEFNCKKNIEIPQPYDEIIYSCINELLINAMKHSKGYYTSISLFIRDKRIYLEVTNFGDYLEDICEIEDGNIGLNILRLNLKQYNGTLNFIMSVGSVEEIFIQFIIEVPIERRIVNENFVN